MGGTSKTKREADKPKPREASAMGASGSKAGDDEEEDAVKIHRARKKFEVCSLLHVHAGTLRKTNQQQATQICIAERV